MLNTQQIHPLPAPHLSHSRAIVNHCPPLEGRGVSAYRRIRGRLNTVTNSFLNIQLKQPLPVQPYSLPAPLQRGIAYYRANADTNYLHYILSHSRAIVDHCPPLEGRGVSAYWRIRGRKNQICTCRITFFTFSSTMSVMDLQR